MGDIFLREIMLPSHVKGFVLLDSDGNYNIYINDLLSDSTKKNAARHELEHVAKDHLHNDKLTLEEKEYKAELMIAL